MDQTKLRLIVGVHIILIQDGKVLLGRRFNTGYEDGQYCTPGGHLDPNETVVEGIIREAREEIGVLLESEHVRMTHVMHRKKTSHERIDFFFSCDNFGGLPTNREPEKCDDLQWFPMDQLPENIIPYIRQAIDASRRGQSFSLFGWN